jgi:anti-sigma-K factor RskA
VNLGTHRARDALIGEYLLGTLQGGARRRFEQLLARDAALAARVDYWQRTMVVKFAKGVEVQPQPATWRRLARTLDLARYRAPWYGRLGFWRGWAIAATAALVLGIGLQVLRPLLDRPAQFALATLADQRGVAAVKVEVIPRDHVLVLAPERPIVAGPNQSYELWLLPADGRAPISLAVLGQLQARVVVSDDNAKLVQNGARLAVSVEPPGGSPTGAPTGPVILVGEVRRG